ncbi:hypothetical protein [Candidatus Palauibacter sp.]|uniref:hypothetical protein n=1 Tax=Candidatus Palauibacter sp. TaxID=3101350 RepID=UPI003B026755
MTNETPPDAHRLSPLWRRLALGLFLIGCGGTAAELLLLEHFEDPWQWTPIALLGAGFAGGVVLAVHATPGAFRVFRYLMWLFMPAGGLGMYLHLKSNVEFERELNPAVGGFDLAVDVLMGAMPALAPGHMIQLGLLGFLVMLRHPALLKPGSPQSGGTE